MKNYQVRDFEKDGYEKAQMYLGDIGVFEQELMTIFYTEAVDKEITKEIEDYQYDIEETEKTKFDLNPQIYELQQKIKKIDNQKGFIEYLKNNPSRLLSEFKYDFLSILISISSIILFLYSFFLFFLYYNSDIFVVFFALILGSFASLLLLSIGIEKHKLKLHRLVFLALPIIPVMLLFSKWQAWSEYAILVCFVSFLNILFPSISYFIFPKSTLLFGDFIKDGYLAQIKDLDDRKEELQQQINNLKEKIQYTLRTLPDSSIQEHNFVVFEKGWIKYLSEKYQNEALLEHIQKINQIKNTVLKNMQNLNKPILAMLDSEAHEAMPYALRQFYITDYQCIKEIQISPIEANNQFIVFLGYNGDGKTSILQALGIALCGNEYTNDNKIGLFIGSPTSHIELQVQTPKKQVLNTFFGKNSFSIESLEIAIGYGASRLQLQNKQSTQNKKIQASSMVSLFDSRLELQNIESYLDTWQAHNLVRYKAVLQILTDLLPNIEKIYSEYDVKISQNIYYYQEVGKAVVQDHLSAGHKSIVAMIGDMIIRLAEAQPEINDPKKFGGIVLIDELEAHLHPKWQREFPKILSEIFPKVQFIVTTHSAICLLGMPRNTAFYKVQRTENEGTTVERIEIDVANLTPNLLLTSPLFGLEDIFSTQFSSVEYLHTGDFFEDKDTRKNAKEKLKALLKQQKEEADHAKSE